MVRAQSGNEITARAVSVYGVRPPDGVRPPTGYLMGYPGEQEAPVQWSYSGYMLGAHHWDAYVNIPHELGQRWGIRQGALEPGHVVAIHLGIGVRYESAVQQSA